MNGQPAPTLRDQAMDAVGQALNARQYWLPVEGRPIAVDAVLALASAELDASQRRAVLFQARLDDARLWARRNLDPEQQDDLLAILGGRESKETPDA